MKKLKLFLLAAIAATIAGIGVASADNVEKPFPMDVPDFHEEALAAGIDHKYTGGWEYFVGGGVASFDCSGDRKPDVFLAGGTSEARLYINRSKTGGELKFEAVDMGLDRKDLTKVLGAYPIDINNDHIV